MIHEGDRQIHAPSLRAGGKGLYEAMEQLAGHWTALNRALDELEPMVGEDVISQLIGGSFQGIRQSANETLQSVMEGLAGHGERVLRTEANNAGAEAATERHIASTRLS